MRLTLAPLTFEEPLKDALATRPLKDDSGDGETLEEDVDGDGT